MMSETKPNPAVLEAAQVIVIFSPSKYVSRGTSMLISADEHKGSYTVYLANA